MPIKLNTASGGGVILTGANTASDKTITVPAVDGTMLTTASTFAGTGPAFSAYQSSAHSFSAGVWTKVQLQTEEFDTNSNFDATTNYRFTPTVAGYYQVNGRITANAIPSVLVVTVYKNGSQWKRGNANANSSGEAVCGSSLVYLNGSTDYIELYAYFSVTQNSFAGLDQTYFQASLARAA